MLKLITGVVTPTTGEIKTKGKIAALLELGAGFNPEYTGIENIYLNGTMMGYTEEEMEKRVPGIVILQILENLYISLLSHIQVVCLQDLHLLFQ